VERTTRGPTAGDRAAGRASFWGRVEDAAGKSAEATLTTPSGYDLTTLTALASVERVLAGDVPPGFHTPSQAFGRDFILSIPGTNYRPARVKMP
jgi:saccharopine dehydrogenase (NAD+, L-lysine-forming)